RLIVGGPPTPTERKLASDFLQSSRDNKAPEAQREALEELCRALFNINRFVYVDYFPKHLPRPRLSFPAALQPPPIPAARRGRVRSPRASFPLGSRWLVGRPSHPRSFAQTT